MSLHTFYSLFLKICRHCIHSKEWSCGCGRPQLSNMHMTTKQEPSHPQLASLGGSLIVAIGDVLGSLWEMRGEEPSAAAAAPQPCEITKDRRRSSSLRTHVVFMLSAAFFSLGLQSSRNFTKASIYRLQRPKPRPWLHCYLSIE